MEVRVVNLQNQNAGVVDLKDEVFTIGFFRPDVIKSVIDWQLAKARSGTRKTKNISEVSGTTKKPFRQKGTGNARQGSLRSVHMRGGAVAHGPRVRSHEFGITKKMRKLAMCHMLSMKLQEGKLILVDNLDVETHKTANLKKILDNFNASSFFVLYKDLSNNNLLMAARNMHHVTAISQMGANVYDMLKHDVVMCSVDAILAIQERL